MSDEYVTIGKPSQDVFTTLQKRRYDFEQYLLNLMPDYQSHHGGRTGSYSCFSGTGVEENTLNSACYDQKNIFMNGVNVNVLADSQRLNASMSKTGVSVNARGVGMYANGQIFTQNIFKPESLKDLVTKLCTMTSAQTPFPVAKNDSAQLYLKAFKDGYVIHMSDSGVVETDIRRLVKMSMDLIRLFDVRIYKIYINDTLVFDAERNLCQQTYDVSQDSMIDLKV